MLASTAFTQGNHGGTVADDAWTLARLRSAWERASVDGRNKGGDAARACLTLMQLEQHFSQASRR